MHIDTTKIARVASAIVDRDITGLNLEERRMVLRHAVVHQLGVRGREVNLFMIGGPTPTLRRLGFKGKAR